MNDFRQVNQSLTEAIEACLKAREHLQQICPHQSGRTKVDYHYHMAMMCNDCGHPEVIREDFTNKGVGRKYDGKRPEFITNTEKN